MKMAVFWFVVPFSLVDVYQHFKVLAALYKTTGHNSSDDSQLLFNIVHSLKENKI
jgi:hypothetical protein